jgi:hypothetical protein
MKEDVIKHVIERLWQTDMPDFYEVHTLFLRAIENGASPAHNAKVHISADEGQRGDSHCSIKIMWEEPA